MSSCCAGSGNGQHPTEPGQCPECGRKGRPVESITLKALLVPGALARLESAPYHFCPTVSCSVVYFNPGGQSIYRKDDVEVRVGVKETEDPVPVCYCFGYTRDSIYEEIQRTAQSTAVETIRGHVQAGRCGCEVNNPSSVCCLGEVSKTVKEGLAWFGHPAGQVMVGGSQ